MFRRFGLILAATAVLVSPAAALAGGYATLGLQSLPEGIEPGEPWRAEFTVLQHGRTPFLDGSPSVTVRHQDGETVGTFPGRLVNKNGLYRARVVFPEAGRYEYVIDDGFSQTHTFPPVTVGDGGAAAAPSAASSSGDGGGSVPLAPVLGGAAGLLAAWLVLLLLTRRSGERGPALGA